MKGLLQKSFPCTVILIEIASDTKLDAIHRNSPAGINLLKVNNRNTRTKCKICSILIKRPERLQWRRSGVIEHIANFEHISHLVLVFLMITLNR